MYPHYDGSHGSVRRLMSLSLSNRFDVSYDNDIISGISSSPRLRVELNWYANRIEYAECRVRSFFQIINSKIYMKLKLYKESWYLFHARAAYLDIIGTYLYFYSTLAYIKTVFVKFVRKRAVSVTLFFFFFFFLRERETERERQRERDREGVSRLGLVPSDTLCLNFSGEVVLSSLEHRLHYQNANPGSSRARGGGAGDK